jgi:plastocyanin
MRRLALVIIAVFSFAPLASAGDIDGRLIGRTFLNPQQPAIVWLEGITTSPSNKQDLVMAQHGGQFVPPFLVVTVGQTVNMPNEDDVAHNVYSSSTPKQFNLGFYAKGDHKSVTFDRPGLVAVLCVIHNFMRAKILVVPNKFYARVSADGTFHIRNVPAGTFTLAFWADGVSQITQQVTVPESGKPVIVRLALPNAP